MLLCAKDRISSEVLVLRALVRAVTPAAPMLLWSSRRMRSTETSVGAGESASSAYVEEVAVAVAEADKQADTKKRVGRR